MNTLRCEVAIIGAGTAGLAAERRARRQGASTLLIDDRFAGTTCATVGCMPSKLLIAAADAAHAVRRAPLFGVEAAPPRVNGAEVLLRVRRERDRLVAGTKLSFNELPDGVRIQGRARFLDRTTLELDDGRRISARAIVIATGSSALIPPAFDAVRDRILTNDTVFDLTELPGSMAVVGAGPQGLELAQAMGRLGVAVRVFDAGDQLAALGDEAVAAEVHAILSKELTVTLGVHLTATREDDALVLAWTGKTEGRQRFDQVLVAAGRPPQLAGLELCNAGIALDDHGVPRYDRSTLQCDGSSIFIAGDANHDRPWLHEASSEGIIAGFNAASFPQVTSSRRLTALSIMFTDPPAASIGDVPEPGDDDVVMGCASYHDQGRAVIFARNAGLAHLYAERATGRLLGATLVGPGVEHLAHLIAWAVQKQLTATEVLDLPFYHPTYEEGLKPALRSICQAVHANEPFNHDDGALPGA